MHVSVTASKELTKERNAVLTNCGRDQGKPVQKFMMNDVHVHVLIEGIACWQGKNVLNLWQGPGSRHYGAREGPAKDFLQVQLAPGVGLDFKGLGVACKYVFL